MTYDRVCTILADTAANTAVDGKPMTKKKKDLIEALMFAYDVLHNQGKVISCKDCKYFFSELGGDYGSCTRIQGGDVVKGTDYCSRGKERDDEKVDI
jgi:hypothetical protein